MDGRSLCPDPQSSQRPIAAAPACSFKQTLLPWLVAVAFFMESLDTTILNTAVPAISAALKVAPLSMKAVLASYTLSLAVFIPISGWMADRFGTRRVFASAIGIFTLGSLLCGISSNIHLLVACRILQGCGGAMMVPVGRLTLVRTFAKSELVQAMSFVAIPGLIGPMLGPVAGGLIVAYFHWRLIFFVNIPIGIVRPIAGVPASAGLSQEHAQPLDMVGLILFGSGIALLSYVLEIFGEHNLSAREILGLLVISMALLAGYWLHASTRSRCCGSDSSGCAPSARRSAAASSPAWASAACPSSSLCSIRSALVYAHSVGPPVHAPGDRRHEHEDDHAPNPDSLRLPRVLVSNTVVLGLLLMAFATIGWTRPSGSSCWKPSATGLSPPCSTPA